ncbi:ubiquinone biosynthesis O-methyltransferase, mitochondrial [Stomoxys calcitrans]|uniref:Ubiquinone biosynthesis O-methyltransferase, mitochondrial n=1 Tax=Stomoxys calcitrans TaxID=35570 RepID=A0A1I8PKG4_STOCA|nr:ubiquinone biosynthesis O-methyltransferase, mitochondrial [Stomoxys calcitrans]
MSSLIKILPFALRQTRRPIACWTANNFQASQRYVQTESNAKENKKSANINEETQREVQHHSKLAIDWWDRNGPMKALHALNVLRVPFIRDGLVSHGNIKPNLIGTTNVLRSQTILEIGCGGGILTEQLARLGASVTALDLGEDLIEAARKHLSQEGNPKLCDLIKYKLEPIELHAKDSHHLNFYDAVVISEVLEHVDDKIGFLTASVQCLKPGGSIFITTLNKTLPMWIGGVLIGEYVMNIAPKGTHHYEKMISPLDVQRILDTMGCHTVLVNGSTYDFWNNSWRWINSTSMCYALQAVKTEI